MLIADEFRRLWQGVRLFALISWFHAFKISGNIIDRRGGVIEQHIARKGNIPEPEYEATLERLFIELAKVNRSIKQAGT